MRGTHTRSIHFGWAAELLKDIGVIALRMPHALGMDALDTWIKLERI